jgi:hypothetical protein
VKLFIDWKKNKNINPLLGPEGRAAGGLLNCSSRLAQGLTVVDVRGIIVDSRGSICRNLQI